MELAELCHRAYWPLVPAGALRIHCGDISADIYETADSLTIAIRGTVMDLASMTRNLRVAIVDGVHPGFAEAARAILDAMPYRVELPHVVTGHSQGGAVADILAYYLRAQVVVSDVVTFGAPRAMRNVMGMSWKGVRRFRYINCADPVPYLVPASLGYSHSVPPTYLSLTGSVVHNPSPLRMLSEAAAYRSATMAVKRTLRPHSITVYRDKLRRAGL